MAIADLSVSDKSFFMQKKSGTNTTQPITYLVLT